MSLKQTYENAQPKNINDFFLVNSINKNRRSPSKDSKFFTKLIKDSAPRQ